MLPLRQHFSPVLNDKQSNLLRKLLLIANSSVWTSYCRIFCKPTGMNEENEKDSNHSEKLADNFFQIDVSPSPILIDICDPKKYLQKIKDSPVVIDLECEKENDVIVDNIIVSTDGPSNKRKRMENKVSHSGPLSTSKDEKDCSSLNSEFDEIQLEEVICDGIFLKQFIPLKTSGKSVFNKNLQRHLISTQKRHYKSGNSKKKRKNSINKGVISKSQPDLVDLTEEISVCNAVDADEKDVLPSSSNADENNVQPSSSNVDEDNVQPSSNVDEDNVQTSSNVDENDVKPSSNVDENDVKPSSSDEKLGNTSDMSMSEDDLKIKEDGKGTNLSSDEEPKPSCSGNVEVKSSCSDEWNDVNSCSDSESDDDEKEKGATLPYQEDYVPLKNITLSDIEYKIDISDEVLKKRWEYEQEREWVLTALGNDIIKRKKYRKGIMCTLLSYNVLAQKLISDNMHLYKQVKNEYLAWEYRWTLLQHEILHIKPDIITFQEVQSSHYHTHYLPWFTELGFESIFKKRTGDKCDGCAIMFNREKFKLIESTTVEYFQPQASWILDRDNIGIIAKLTPVEFNSTFCVATTHILYNPRRKDIKLAQTALLLTEMDRICFEGVKDGQPVYCPAMLTGDFNAESFSQTLNFLVKGQLTMPNAFANGIFNLGISKDCQHFTLEQSRFVERTRGQLFSLKDKRKIEKNLIRLRHSEWNPDPQCSFQQNLRLPYTSTLSHAFKWKSLYPSIGNLADGVSTFQDRWITVDFMLYTRAQFKSRWYGLGLYEKNLRLLAHYVLPTVEQAQKFGPLPSAVCPSDHFPLAAQFLITKRSG